MYAVLHSSQVNSSAPLVCMHDRSSNPRGRACRPSGKGSGKEGILSGVVPSRSVRTVSQSPEPPRHVRSTLHLYSFLID